MHKFRSLRSFIFRVAPGKSGRLTTPGGPAPHAQGLLTQGRPSRRARHVPYHLPWQQLELGLFTSSVSSEGLLSSLIPLERVLIAATAGLRVAASGERRDARRLHIKGSHKEAMMHCCRR
jgi:hypothetical protein